VILAKAFGPAAEQGATNCEAVRSALAAPEHAGVFETLANDRPATRLNHPRADEEPSFNRIA